MELIQDRLDVKNKTRSNLFNWRGQFTPQFADYILESFASNGEIVVDPFSGSGTVLLESAGRGLACYGYEVNPAAYAMSKFFSFCNILPSERNEVVFRFQNKVSKLVNKYHDLPMLTVGSSFRERYIRLLDFSRDLFSQMNDLTERILAINTLFTAEDYKDGNIGSSISRAAAYIGDCFVNLPYSNKPIIARLGDARLLHHSCPASAKLILTSPPYINVFNYHQNHRAILETLGWDILKIAQSEIGSNRKNRGNRFRTVVQYCLDMELTLKSFWKCLVNDGIVVIVIGRESNVMKTPFYNGEIVTDIAKNMGAFKDVQNFTRKFINRFGSDIKEDIIILHKSSTYPGISIAKDISLEHLKSSLRIAPEAAKDYIQDAMACVDLIQPSPFLSARRD
ncbi:MAG: DNA methyltransferase [Dehalococcoidia bacterium]